MDGFSGAGWAASGAVSPGPVDDPRDVPAAPSGPRAGVPGGVQRLRPVARLDPGRCSVQALVRGDSGLATAPPARRWLLVEQPGPWGRDALAESRFDRQTAGSLAQRAAAEGVRVQMVRHAGERLADSARRWAYVDTTPGVETAWWSTRSEDRELLEVPWDGSVGTPDQRPTYLVCTHGAHDACCAVRGRPLARGLPAPSPGDVWETSHLGGCRFASNVVVLPTGCYYGQVPGDGAAVVAAHERGEVALPWLRGRAGLPPAAQAAQHHARQELGLLGLHELSLLRVDTVPAPDAGAERWSVALAAPEGDVVVVVESRPSAEAERLTCSAVRRGHWRTWHPVSLRAPTGT